MKEKRIIIDLNSTCNLEHYREKIMEVVAGVWLKITTEELK